jgi:hypothetical protein
VTDITGHNNATPSGFSGTGLSSNVPTGKSGYSVDFGSSTDSTVIKTTATKLLSSQTVASYGGFTMDAWIYCTNTTISGDSQSIIDYAGTEALRISPTGYLSFYEDGATTLTSFALSANAWHHATVTFNTSGYSAVADPNYSGNYKITGVATLYVDGVSIGSDTVTKSGKGDSLSRSIGVGCHPANTAWDNYSGLIYDASVTLGVESVPEPSAMVLLSIGLASLLAYAWRKRRN